MSVQELIDELSKLPPDNTLSIEYFHEDNPNKKYSCDVHDILVGTGILKYISYLELVGRGEPEE